MAQVEFKRFGPRVLAREPILDTGKKLKAGAAPTPAFKAEFPITLAGLGEHQVHVGQDGVAALRLGQSPGFLPEVLVIHAQFVRDEGVFLHISGREGPVEIVGEDHSRALEGHGAVLAGRATWGNVGSPTLELRWTLLHESHDAFTGILGARGVALHIGLLFDLVMPSCVHGRPNQVSGVAE